MDHLVDFHQLRDTSSIMLHSQHLLRQYLSPLQFPLLCEPFLVQLSATFHLLN